MSSRSAHSSGARRLSSSTVRTIASAASNASLIAHSNVAEIRKHGCLTVGCIFARGTRRVDRHTSEVNGGGTRVRRCNGAPSR